MQFTLTIAEDIPVSAFRTEFLLSVVSM
uniref:Uncharacterized protein n=1 Tax=Anguilla anguilla TaxID=7936 RepID=A0A0E9SZP8_ANGAN